MKKRLYFFAAMLLSALMIFGLTACANNNYTSARSSENTTYLGKSAGSEVSSQAEAATVSKAALTPDGTYTTKDDVALYIHTYGKLPSNFITKKEAQALGWSGGSLESYAPGKCIGGDRFGNYEGTLPKNHTYHECDINTLGADSRGAERIVYSDDGLIYYTNDHYTTFTLLYGE